MTPAIEALIVQIENETGVSANTKTRIGTALRAISNERPYTVYRALITQESEVTPTVEVKQNSTGRTWTMLRDDPGVFYLQSNIPFVNEKVSVFIGNTNSAAIFSARAIGTTDILINIVLPSIGSTDGLMTRTPIRIEIEN